MKKYLYSAIALLSIASVLMFENVAWADSLIDSYATSNYAGGSTVGDTFSDYGEVFYNSSNITLSSASFYLWKSGSPTGNIVVKLYALTGTPGTNAVPTGAALAVSNPIDVSTLQTSHTITTFTFSGSNQVSLVSGTYYGIDMYLTGEGSPNYVWFGYGNASIPASHNYFRYSSSWSALTNLGIIFYVYGTTGGTLHPSSVLINSGSFNIKSGNLIIK